MIPSKHLRLLYLILALLLVGCSGDNNGNRANEAANNDNTTANADNGGDADNNIAETDADPTAEPTLAPTPEPTPNPLYTSSSDYPWWNDAVFYQIFVRTFNDSDGDGVGDFTASPKSSII